MRATSVDLPRYYFIRHHKLFTTAVAQQVTGLPEAITSAKIDTRHRRRYLSLILFRFCELISFPKIAFGFSILRFTF